MGTARDHGVTGLYNYQPTIDFLEGNLRENHIHCSSPENFNDPWDCKPCFDSSSIDDPEQRSKWIAFFKEQYALMPPEEQASIERCGPLWYEDSALLRRSIEKTTESVWKNNARRFRVFCLTAKPTSLLMWAHYGNKHKGVCLELDATAEKLWRARRVVYTDKLPLANADLMRQPEILLETSLLTKSADWCYEEEYRLLGRDNDPTFSLATQDDFLKLPAGAITAVIAGCRASINDVLEIVRKVAPSLPVKRAVRRAHEYYLDIID